MDAEVVRPTASRSSRARHAAHVRHASARLARLWDATTPAERRAGARWYRSALSDARALSDAYGIAPAQAVGVIAALSPRMRWSVNLRMAERVCAAHARGAQRAPRAGFRRNVLKGWRIARGAPAGATLSGPKVRAFYANIMGAERPVTLDVWAMRAALGRWDAPAPREGQMYETFERAYQRAADSVGVPPREFQATIWIHVRGAEA